MGVRNAVSLRASRLASVCFIVDREGTGRTWKIEKELPCTCSDSQLHIPRCEIWTRTRSHVWLEVHGIHVEGGARAGGVHLHDVTV
jgi:hypothetical protein